jgi:hypothetical protein
MAEIECGSAMPSGDHTELGHDIDQWLASLGFRFDPFRELDAGRDDRLHEYLVGHETFEAIRGDDISFVLAPIGGGKSAFRVRLARACRVGEHGRRLFPIVYMLPETVILAKEAERWQIHLHAILQAAAFELLLRLAYRPHEFSDLDLPARKMVRFLLERRLPSPLAHLLAQLETPADLRRLAQSYDPTARWPNPPDAKMLQGFCQAMEQTLPIPEELILMDEFNAWLELLHGPLSFDAIYLLLDGVDAYPETSLDAGHALALLSPLFEQARAWMEQRLFLKAFLPLKWQSALQGAFPLLTSQAKVAIIEWTAELLTQVLRSRLEAASEMAPASLDMLGNPGFRGLDDRLARAVEPRPRELLLLVERILFEHVLRAGPVSKLTSEDLEAAFEWYVYHRPPSQ